MAKFISRRHLNLGFLGEEWKDCFAVFSSLSVIESRDLMTKKLQTKAPEEIVDITLGVLAEHFIEGAVYDSESKTVVKLAKEQLGELPQPFLEKAVLFLVGGPESTTA